MTGQRKLHLAAFGLVSAIAAVSLYLASLRVRPQATVVVKPGKAGSLVAVLTITNATDRSFAVSSLLQTQERSFWGVADEQPRAAADYSRLSGRGSIQHEVELPPVRRTYRFRCGYQPYDPPTLTMRVVRILEKLQLPGALGYSYQKALGLLWPKPKLFFSEPFQTWQVAQATPPAGSLQGFAAEPRMAVRYSDGFRSHYPTRGRRFELDGYELEAPVVVWDVGHHRKITVVRTTGSKYGYDQQRGIITITGEELDQPRFLSLMGFRHVRASWVSEKLVFIELDLGHVAGVDAIYDVEDDKFVYRQSLLYEWPGGQAGPVPQNQPPPAPDTGPLETAPVEVADPQQAPTTDPQEPPALPPIGFTPSVLLTKEAREGMTYQVGVYVVKRGDGLVSIAEQHQVTLKELRDLNPELTNDVLLLGQEVRVYEKPSR